MAEMTEEMTPEESFAAFGAVLLAWDTPEYRRYQRGKWWYAGMGAAALGLLIYCVASANFLFALIVLMIALVVYMTSVGEQRQIRLSITEAGLHIGESFYPYKDINRFWLAYEPPAVRSLYIDFKSAVRPRMTIDLGDTNPLAVREALIAYLPEDTDEDGEPLSDIIARFLKI